VCEIYSQNAEFPVVVAVDSRWLLVMPVGTPFAAATFRLEHLKLLLWTLKTVHEAKIVHCDVRFANIYLVEDNRVLLNDWGSSIRYDPCGCGGLSSSLLSSGFGGCLIVFSKTKVRLLFPGCIDSVHACSVDPQGAFDCLQECICLC
jgi:serine/threonine protein kinase